MNQYITPLEEITFWNGYRNVDGIVTEINTVDEMATVAFLTESGNMFKLTASFDDWNWRLDRAEQVAETAVAS